MVCSVFRQQVELQVDSVTHHHMLLFCQPPLDGALLFTILMFSPSSHQSQLEGEEQIAEASVLECISETFTVKKNQTLSHINSGRYESHVTTECCSKTMM